MNQKQTTVFWLAVAFGTLALMSCGEYSELVRATSNPFMITAVDSNGDGQADGVTPSITNTDGEPTGGGDGGDNPPPPSTELPPTPGGILNPTGPTEGDDGDGDGIPNPQDEIPNVCTAAQIRSYGVSSAKIYHVVKSRADRHEISRTALADPSDFYNADNMVLNRSINLSSDSGEVNLIEILLAGSPGDRVEVEIFDCSKDPAKRLLFMTAVRTTGTPVVTQGIISTN